MNGRVVAVHDLSEADKRAWESLSARAAEPNPLFEPSCVLPAARHQWFGDDIELVVAEDGFQFQACFPLMDIQSWKRVRYPFVTSQVRRMGYLGTPLVDTSAGTGAMAALLAAVRERREFGRARVLVLDGIGDDGPVAGFIRAAARELGLPVFVWESYERGVLHRRGDGDYVGIFGRKERYELDRRRRRFAEEFGSEMTVVDAANEPGAIDEYIAIEAAGYKGDIGVAMSSVSGEPEYFREMCGRFAAAGRLILPTLRGAEQTLAMEVWLRGAGGIFMIKTSFDEKYARFAPGKQLHLAAMAHFHNETDANWIDTCTSADNDYLLHLYPERRRISTLLIPLSRNPVDSAFVVSMLAARKLRRRLLRNRRTTAAPRGRTPSATNWPQLIASG